MLYAELKGRLCNEDYLESVSPESGSKLPDSAQQGPDSIAAGSPDLRQSGAPKPQR